MVFLRQISLVLLKINRRLIEFVVSSLNNLKIPSHSQAIKYFFLIMIPPLLLKSRITRI